MLDILSVFRNESVAQLLEVSPQLRCDVAADEILRGLFLLRGRVELYLKL